MLRRDFLEWTRFAAMAAIIPDIWRIRHRPRFLDDPFSLGIASGDPTADAVMLWTRLAPRPLEPGYGMEGVRTAVTWEVAADEGFRRMVQTGRATAAPELGHSVHVDVQGLEPDRWYYYRFQTGDARSTVGRTRTAPADQTSSPLRFGVVSCQNYEQGLYTAYEHLAREELDLVTHLGDYIYEHAGVGGRVRRHATTEIQSVEDYRIRYAQYKSDPLLQAAHATCPWVVTWDDHEVDNNYTGDSGELGMESVEQVRARRAAGYQAWWENQPVRAPRALSWSDLTITRSVRWGTLARFWVLDTRQYRSDQPCGDGNRMVPCGDWGSPSHTMLGEAQERWLVDGLGSSGARWQVLAQQVMMAPFEPIPGQQYMDAWSGYPGARDRLLRAIAERAANRTVVLTGDIHSNWVNELPAGFHERREDSRPVAAEFVGTSISSGGDGAAGWGTVNERSLPENPHIKWHTARRGYLTCRVGADDWQTDYREVPYITRPGAPVHTASSWRLAHGRPGIVPA
jgi:alkaline phosphatase D